MSPRAAVLISLSAAALALLSPRHARAYAPDDTCGHDNMAVYFPSPLPARFDLLLDGKPCVSVTSSQGQCTVTAARQSACYELGQLTHAPSGCFEDEGGKFVAFQVYPGHQPRLGVPFTMVARIWTKEGVTVREGKTSMDFWVPPYTEYERGHEVRCYYGVVHF
ncbi:hypothetical protein [Polyangium fumosum]|uniref:Uncharacterized protein n=1 Tax=Polyangium fumosum TaxID=889272 RepID=A0A4U1IS33_9BACT|nr:hypothetical protein [Polyangium fumosum]TKC97129.1 hypothetical protein E8A74_44255 [Polyangium fumosum]